MLGLNFVKANRAAVERAIRDKGVDVDLDALLALDSETRETKTEIDRLRAERNAVSARFKDAAPAQKAELGRQAKEAGARASALEAGLASKEAELKALQLKLPGIPYEGAPVGPGRKLQPDHPHGRRGAEVRLRAARPRRADREEPLGRPEPGDAGVRIADLLPEGWAGAA